MYLKEQLEKDKNTQLLSVIEKDCTAVTDTELLTLLLGDDSALAKSLLAKHGSFAALCKLPYPVLEFEVPKHAKLLKACLAVPPALYGTNKGGRKREVFTLDALHEYFAPYFTGAETEKMYLLLIDRSSEVVANILIAEGSVETMEIDPKLIISNCVKYNAVRAVLAHNHFSGSRPSSNDVIVTSKAVWLLGHMGIELCDHLIFCRDKVHSMFSAGEMSPIGYNMIFGSY